jgi:PAS domain S-box-containing protein
METSIGGEGCHTLQHDPEQKQCSRDLLKAPTVRCPLLHLAGSFLLFFACCLTVALSGMSSPLHASSETPPHVVILNSYHQGDEWTDKELAGILPVLHSAYPALPPSVEYLDFKRNPGRPHLDNVKGFLKAKYRDKPIDLVMALDNRALSLVLDAGDTMFPETPLVFAGVNGFTPEMIQKRPMTTGVAEEQDIAGTLEMALKLLPETKQVLVIHDYTSSGLAVRQEAETALSSFSDRVQIDYSPAATMAGLRQLLAEQPPDTIALLLTFVTDSEGRTFSRDESTRLISSAADLPVFAMHETRLGDGILGGMLLFGEEHGKQAAEIALRIFNGENPRDISVTHSRSVPMADYTQLQRFDIPESMLPPGTALINKPTSTYARYKLEIQIIAALVVVQLLFIIVLFLFHRRAKQARKELRKAELEYRDLFENAPVGIFKTNWEGRFLSVNPQGAAMFGFDSPRDMMENVTKMGSQLYANPSDRMEEMDLLRRKGKVSDRPWASKRKDGTLLQTSYSARVFYDDSGNIEYVDGFITDITERKRAEDALRKSELKFRSYFDLGVVGMAISSPDKQWIVVNDRLCDILGYSREEMQSLTWVDVTHPDDLQESLERYEQVLRGERNGYVANKQYIHKDGKNVHVLVSVGVVRKPDGGIDYLVVLVQDITELKQTEGALVASEERYRTIFDSVGDIIQIYDLEGRILDTNQAACDRLGYSQEELIGMNLRDIDGPESAAGVGERLARIQKDGQLSFEVEHIKRDGSSIFTELNSRLMAFKGRDVVFSVGRDITGRKQMEEAMVKAKEAAETANKAKSEFLANMSHEIRTPLNGVLGMLQLLQTMPLGKEEQEYIDLALISGKGLLRVINDILSFSKIEAGMLEIKKNPFDIAFTIHSLMEIFRQDAQVKGLSFRCKVDSAMPPVLLGDEERLREILFNLVGNALKFTEHGEVAVTAKLAPPENSSSARVCLTISDTGIGIPSERLEDLCQPFTQADGSHTRKFGGTGLGLSIVKRLAGLMGGELDIRSKIGEGTSVTIQLDFSLPGLEQTPSIPVPPDHLRSPAEHPYLRILVVEDDPTNRLLMVKLLETLGHTVVAKEDGEKALAILRTAPFDAVFMDIQMPVMDGVETTKRIRSDTSGDFSPSLPIIALTAHAMEGDKESFLDAGMNDYLAKPLVRDDLVVILKKLYSASHPAKKI